MEKVRLKLSCLLLLSSLIASCTSQPSARPTASVPGDPSPGGGTSGPTYYADVAPILGRHCVSCHSPGQIGPFPLTSYDEVVAHADAIGATVAARYMPPFAPRTEGCRPIDDPRNMGPVERQTLVVWATGQRAEGDAKSAAPIPHPDDPLGPPSVSVDSGVDYLARKQVSDDYRCFAIDPHITATFPLVAASVSSTDPAIVHHAMIYTQPEEQNATVDALDSADPGPGYDCFGGVGYTGGFLLTVGAVGSSTRPFAPGASVQLNAGTRFVVQVHTNYANGYRPNRFTLNLWRADKPLADIPNLVELINNDFVIPPGAPSAQASDTRKMPAGVLHTIFPHMHQLGKSFHAEVTHVDGSHECLIDIPGNWDFHWQGIYQLANPVALDGGDEVTITCEWDNSAANQPIVDGKRQTPVEVHYGDKSTDEMCIAYLMITDP